MDSPQPDQGRPFQRLLTVLGRDQDGIRLCTAGADQPFHVIPSLFRPDTVDIAVAAFTEKHLDVWFEINYAPHVAGGRTSEKDVTRLSALYVDIDFKGSETGKQGMGSEPAALELCDMLAGALGVAPAAILWSGHGLQAYWPVEDGAIDDINQQDIINLSKRWGLLCMEMARAEGGAVDNIFDLARIFRAPGSTNWKNPARPAPTRIEFPQGNLPLTVEEIGEVLDAHGIRHPDTAELAGEVVSPPSEWAFADADCHHVAIIMEGVNATPNSRHHWLLQQATLLTASIRYGCITKDTFRQYRKAIEQRLQQLLTSDASNTRAYSPYEVESAFRRALLNVQTMSQVKLEEEMRRHPHPVLRLIRQAEQASDAGQSNVRIKNEATPTNPGPDIAFDGGNVLKLQPREQVITNEFAYTDASNADRLADYVEADYIFVPGIGWHRWEEGCYTPDEETTIMERAKESLLAFRRSYPTVDDVHAHVKKSLSAGGLRASVALAETLPQMVVPPHQLDGKPYDLPTPGGIVDLNTGILRPARPRIDLNTMRTAVTPERMPTPQWDAFMLFCMQTPEMVAYMQRLLGATLIGEPRFHILPILTGDGGNGKSTLLNIVEWCLGGFAKRMDENFLIEQRNQQHPQEIARLRGCRLAIASEAKANGRFAEARVKALTGEKRLTGRFMGENSFDFNNSITMWLLVNHLPAVAAGGKGFWRRIRKIALKGKILKEIENLENLIFDAEGPGILQWMIDGAVEVIANGLQDPEAVKQATKEYEVEEDHLGQWVADNLMVNPTVGALKDEVYRRYKRFAVDAAIPVLSKSVFARELHHYIEINEFTSTPTVYGGIALAVEQLGYGPLAPAPNVRLTHEPLPPTPGAPGLFDTAMTGGSDE